MTDGPATCRIGIKPETGSSVQMEDLQVTDDANRFQSEDKECIRSSSSNHTRRLLAKSLWKIQKGREPYRVKGKKILRSTDIGLEDVPLLPKHTEPWEQTTTTQRHLQQQKERIRQVILDK